MFISNSNTAPFQMKPARKTFGKRQSYKSTLSLSYGVNIKLFVQKIKRNDFLTYHEMHSTKTFWLTQKQKCFILNLLAARQCAHNTSRRQETNKKAHRGGTPRYSAFLRAIFERFYFAMKTFWTIMKSTKCYLQLN